MSLPAGASITTIGGKRCTAIPRSAAAVSASSNLSATSEAADAAEAVAATTTPPAAAATTPAAAAIIASSSSTIQAALESSTSNAAVAAAAVEPSISQPSSTPAALPSSIQSTASPPAQSTSNTDAIQVIVPTTTSATGQVAEESQTALLTPTTTTPAVSSELTSSVSIADVQSESSVTPSLTSQSLYPNQTADSTIGYASPTRAAESPTQSPTALTSTESSSSRLNIGAVVGGILGGVALVGLLLFLLRRYIKRSKSRDSLLVPLNGSFGRRGDKYEIDGDSLGPTPLGKRLTAQVGGFCSRIGIDLIDWGSAVKTQLSRDSGAPSVNLNRGNSQFLESAQQHDRSDSATTGERHTSLTARDRFLDWWQRLTEDINFNWRIRLKANDPIDHFTATHGMSEKEPQTNQASPSFSQFLFMKDQELRQSAGGHRRSQSTATLPQLGSLGLEFSGTSDPFADPFPNIQPTIPNISKPQEVMTSNPFADPTLQNYGSDYASEPRRSRGLSMSIPKSAGPVSHLPSNTAIVNSGGARRSSIPAPSSRYPSTIRTSRDTYRDTVLSALSVSGRNAKGRSDPFDLDRPELLRQPPPIPLQNETGSSTTVKLKPRIEAIQTGKSRTASNAGTYASSKYSSGVSAMLSEWGDPGPDLGPIAWRRLGAEEGSIGSNDATRGSVSSGTGSHIITVGRAL